MTKKEPAKLNPERIFIHGDSTLGKNREIVDILATELTTRAVNIHADSADALDLAFFTDRGSNGVLHLLFGHGTNPRFKAMQELRSGICLVSHTTVDRKERYMALEVRKHVFFGACPLAEQDLRILYRLWHDTPVNEKGEPLKLSPPLAIILADEDELTGYLIKGFSEQFLRIGGKNRESAAVLMKELLGDRIFRDRTTIGTDKTASSVIKDVDGTVLM